MGTDVSIYVRTRDGAEPPALRTDCHDWARPHVRPAHTGMGATHYIWTGDRYFGAEPTWAKKAGFWPQIREVLVALLGACECVWYTADTTDDPSDYLYDLPYEQRWALFSEQTKVTPERLVALDAAYFATVPEADRDPRVPTPAAKPPATPAAPPEP